jgi:hypothetical protein
MVSQRFLEIFLLTNRFWSKRVKTARVYESLQSYLTSVINAFEYLGLTRVLLFIAAIGLLWEFPNYSQRPISLTNHMGFLCLYLVLFQYFFYALALLAASVLRFLLAYHNSGDRESSGLYYSYQEIFPTVGALVAVLGMTGFLILLQILFSSRNIPFPFYILSLPIWCITASATLAVLIMFALRTDTEKSILCFLSIFNHGFPLTILLVGLYYDFPNSIRSLGFVMIPTYPFQFTLILFLMLTLNHSLTLWGAYRDRDHAGFDDVDWRIIRFKLFVNNFRNLLLFGMLFVLLYLDVILFLSDSSWCSFEIVLRLILFTLLISHVWLYLSAYEPKYDDE